MAREIEAKFRLPDPQPLRARLLSLGARRISCVLETNRIFDTPGRRLLQTDCGLRVRTARPLGAPGDPAPPPTAAQAAATLTFKGPRTLGELKSREEIETTLGNPSAAVHILTRLGLDEVIAYEKRRETWRLGACDVTLDELPRLGWYAEIEGPDPPSVASARVQLGLAGTPPVAETYVHLAAAHGQEDADGRRHLFFTG